MTEHRRRRALGFSWPALVGLAALAAPRVVLHDLGVIEEGSFVNGLLVFVPLACWIAAVLWRRPSRPFLTTVALGVIYGIFLAAGHMLFWDAVFEGGPLTSGGPLVDVDPSAQEAFLRGHVLVSSLLTGTAVGVITGAVALVVLRVVRPRSERRPSGRPGPGA
jgi:hypothetical protein